MPQNIVVWFTWWQLVREVGHGRWRPATRTHTRDGIFLVLFVDVIVTTMRVKTIIGIDRQTKFCVELEDNLKLKGSAFFGL